MPIYARDTGGGSDFQPCPPGWHTARCCDVIDIGMKETQYGLKPKVRIVWMTGLTVPDSITADNPYGMHFVVSKQYTLSLHRNAWLRKDLEAWRGKAFTAEELSGFDLEKLIDVPAYLNVLQEPNAAGDTTYANVKAIATLPDGFEAPIIPPEYQRRKDRDAERVQQTGPPPTPAPAVPIEQSNPPGYSPPPDNPPPPADDSIPF